ncbi:MAG TPA: ABC transporter ATP-binding protein [Firmicutes bacterium]|nr:ABC transporter ATP-binding protein [Bacillota bacterium]
MGKDETLLCIEDLTIGFPTGKCVKRVVDHISLEVKKGEILGILGESGSGKTITALAVMGLLPAAARILRGRIQYRGRDLLTLEEGERRRLRGAEISMVYQDPMASFNPLLTVGAQVEEMLRLHAKHTQEEYRALTLKALKEVGLTEPLEVYHRYPHQLSGGMRQRAMLAMAIIAGPKLVLADEPTTALDVTTQGKILQLLRELNEKYGMSIVLISHDLRVIQNTCHRAIVMKDGRIVEAGMTQELFARPQTKYTRQLVAAAPRLFSDGGGLRVTCAKNTSYKEQREIFTIQNLNVFYPEKGSGLLGKKRRKQVIKNANISVLQGETLGIVGESGSGKSTLAKAIVGLNREIEGVIKFNDVAAKGKGELAARPQMVFQDPFGSLNPTKKIGWLLEEPLKLQTNLSKKERIARVREMIRQVGLTYEFLERYPSQLSGGQRQRAAIAAALIVNPKLVILDEPVSSLDVTIQAQILRLLKELQDKYSLTYLFISHDLNVVFQICNRVCVLYRGEIIEIKEAQELLYRPQHEYTKELLESAMVKMGNRLP